MTDKDVLGCALATIKHQAHLYHGLCEHTGNAQLLQEISNLLFEKQKQRLKIFQAMNARGWYNPQLIASDQLQQHKSRMVTVLQQLQQQVSGSQNQPHIQPQVQPHGGWHLQTGTQVPAGQVGALTASQHPSWSGQF